MDCRLYVLSSHPLAGAVLVRCLAADPGLRRGLHSKPYSNLSSVPQDQVFQLVVRRLSNKEIADALKISERTAKFHLSNIFVKLGVNSRAALVETVDAATYLPAPAIKAGHV